jgi:hypothetical protein
LLHKNTSVPTAYFPVVWGAYNPQSIQLVETFLRQEKHQPNFTLDEFSEHSGNWLPRGTGMYVIRGSDARLFRFDTTLEGWGNEDTAFYYMIGQHRRLVRRHETGLIHVWHDKSCAMGKEAFTKEQMKACEKSRIMGSKLAQHLRRNETDVWHDKSCVMGQNVFNKWQRKACENNAEKFGEEIRKLVSM